MTIWKYPLPITNISCIPMPRGAKVLTVQTQEDGPYLWVLIDEKAAPMSRYFAVYGTGHPLSDNLGTYIGTFQIEGGALVFHVFETEVSDAAR